MRMASQSLGVVFGWQAHEGALCLFCPILAACTPTALCPEVFIWSGLGEKWQTLLVALLGCGCVTRWHQWQGCLPLWPHIWSAWGGQGASPQPSHACPGRKPGLALMLVLIFPSFKAPHKVNEHYSCQVAEEDAEGLNNFHKSNRNLPKHHSCSPGCKSFMQSFTTPVEIISCPFIVKGSKMHSRPISRFIPCTYYIYNTPSTPCSIPFVGFTECRENKQKKVSVMVRDKAL